MRCSILLTSLLVLTLNAADTDTDGIPDDWETFNFGNLTDANATSDADNDGYSDLEEYQSYMNASDPTTDESIQVEASRRMPPMIASLSIAEQMNATQTYTLEWKAIGYDEGYITHIALFDCTGIAAGNCGNSYVDNFFTAEVPAVLVENSPWEYRGERANYFSYTTSFTVPATREGETNWASGGTPIVVRFYESTLKDEKAGKSATSLLVPGNVTAFYYDATGRRISKTICPSGGCE